jgi:hypothetical protein
VPQSSGASLQFVVACFRPSTCSSSPTPPTLQLYWGVNHQPSSLVGGDPLNTAALSVWGFMRAAFGVTWTLSGLTVVSPPAASMAGARWNVSVLGQPACLLVGDGITTYCNGSAI